MDSDTAALAERLQQLSQDEESQPVIARDEGYAVLNGDVLHGIY